MRGIVGNLCVTLCVSGCNTSRHLHTKPHKGTSVNTQVTPFLMFQGQAKQAVEFYISLFSASRVEEEKLYGAGEAGQEGTVDRAVFSIAGQRIM